MDAPVFYTREGSILNATQYNITLLIHLMIILKKTNLIVLVKLFAWSSHACFFIYCP